MVPPDSHRISRVPRYSGYCYASYGFVYGAIARYGMLFQTFPLTIFHAISQSYNPNNAGTSLVWALPRSLATTWGIIRLFSLPTGTKMFQFPAFAHYIRSVSNLQLDGLSHSEILGSKVICTYPRLFAAYHVLHRLQEPRHPPYALSYLFSALLLLMSGVCWKLYFVSWVCFCKLRRLPLLLNLLVFFFEIVLLKNLVLSNMSKIVCNKLLHLCGEYRGRTDDLLHAMQAL